MTTPFVVLVILSPLPRSLRRVRDVVCVEW